MSRLVLCDGKSASYRLYVDGVPRRYNEFGRKLWPDEVEQYRTDAVSFLKSIGGLPPDESKDLP